MSNAKDEAAVMMTLPQNIIDATVQAAIANVLKERGDQFIEECVKQVLSKPAKDGYRDKTRRVNGREVPVTWFGDLLERAITGVCEEAAKEWLEEERGAIKKAMRAQLGRTRKDVIAKIADTIIDGMSEPSVSLRMRFGDDGERY